MAAGSNELGKASEFQQKAFSGKWHSCTDTGPNLEKYNDGCQTECVLYPAGG